MFFARHPPSSPLPPKIIVAGYMPDCTVLWSMYLMADGQFMSILVLHQPEQSLFVFLLRMQTNNRWWRMVWLGMQRKVEKMLGGTDDWWQVTGGYMQIHRYVGPMHRPCCRH